MENSVKYGIAFLICLVICYLIYYYFFKAPETVPVKPVKPDTPSPITMIVQTPVVTPPVVTPPVVTPPVQTVASPVVPPVVTPPAVALSPMEKYLQDENSNVAESISTADKTWLVKEDPLDFLNKELLLGYNRPNATPAFAGFLSAAILKENNTGKNHVFILNSRAVDPNTNKIKADRFMLVDAGAGKVYIKHIRSGFYLSLVHAADNTWTPSGIPDLDLTGPLKYIKLVENPHDEKWTIKNIGDQMYKLVYKTGEEMEVTTSSQNIPFSAARPMFVNLIGHSKLDKWHKTTQSANDILELTIMVL